MTDVVTNLRDQGSAIWPNFLTPPEVSALSREMDALRRSGGFRRAGVSRLAQVENEIRRDFIHWWDADALSSAQNRVWARLRAFRKQLNQDLFLGLRSFEGHYALYPSGAFYRKHLDQVHGGKERRLSLVLYLNAGRWTEKNGGLLRLHASAGGATYQDILPEAGKLVCFLSDEVFHEVLPTRRERKSFVGWFG